NTGVDFGAVTTATCLSAALATAIMALYARYPIAQAPGMGENFFFVFSALPAATAAGFTNGWQVALGVVFVSGVLFLILSLIGLRELIFNSVSPSMKNGIAAGIGLFIAFIGLQQAGIIIKDPASAAKLNTHFASPDSIVFFLVCSRQRSYMHAASAAQFSGALSSPRRWPVCSKWRCHKCPPPSPPRTT